MAPQSNIGWGRLESTPFAHTSAGDRAALCKAIRACFRVNRTVSCQKTQSPLGRGGAIRHSLGDQLDERDKTGRDAQPGVGRELDVGRRISKRIEGEEHEKESGMGAGRAGAHRENAMASDQTDGGQTQNSAAQDERSHLEHGGDV